MTAKKFLLTGTVAIALSFGLPALAATTVVTTSGPIAGGTGTDAPDAVTAATPGVQFGAGATGIDVTNSGYVFGGHGFNAMLLGTAGTDGAVGLDFNGDNGTLGNTTTFTNTHTASILGGSGGNGASGVFMAGTAGGNGGNGAVGVQANANYGVLDTGSFTFADIDGGTGGLAGMGGGANAGGNGGNGAIALDVIGSNFLAKVSQAHAGSGADGSQSAGLGANGNGGDGGAGIVLGGASDTLTVYNFVQGGSGGAGADANGAGSTGGTGGNAGPGIVTSSSGAQIFIYGGVISGKAGAGGAANGGTAGADGVASASILFGAGTTGANLTNSGSIYGGYGGSGSPWADGIDITGGAAVTSITNDSSGSIGDTFNQTRTGLNIGTGSTLGTLTNSGMIASTNDAGLIINGALTTLDNAAGLITTASASGDVDAALVLNSTAQGALTNDGIISNTGGGVALAFTAAPAGAFTNAAGGTIEAANSTDTAVDFVATGSLINNGKITGGINTTIGSAVTVTNTGTITGDLELGGTGSGILNMNGGTITGDVDLLGSTNGGVLNLNGGQIIGATAVYKSFSSANGTINVGGDYTTGGIITSAGADLNVTAGTFNIQNAVYIGSSGAITNAGIIRIGAGDALTIGTQNPGGNYIFDVASNASYGKLTLTAGAVTLTYANTAANVLGGQALTPGGLLQIASGMSAAGVTPGMVTDHSALYNFTLESGAAAGANVDDAYLLVSAATTGLNGNQRNAFAAINGTNSTDPDFMAVRTNLQNASTDSEARRDLDKAGPTTDGGAVQAATDATDTLFGLTDQQLALLRTDDSMTGMAAGDRANGLRSWAQGFGGHASQGDRNGDAGYSANTAGGAFGVDSQELLDDSVLGLSFAYGHTHVGNNFDQDTQVNSYQATAYGSHYLTGTDKALFVDGMAALQYGRNDETRNGIGGVAGLDATGTYNSYEGAGRAELGRDFGLRELGGVTLTPTVLTDYTYYHQESYSESGAGGANLNVGGSSENIWNVGLGGQATWLFRNDNGSSFKPDVRVNYKHDLLNDNAVDVTSTFAAGGPSFRTNGLRQGRDALNAGFDARFYATTNWELTASYDFTLKQQYTAHTGLIRAAYKF